MSNTKRPYRINGQDVVVKSENVLYSGIDNIDNVDDALDDIVERLEDVEENGGGLSSDDIVNDLTTGGTTKALSAEMGKTLNQAIDDKLTAVTVNNIPAGSVNVVDNLESSSSTSVLSAKQGKTLQDRKQPRMEVFVAANDAPAWQKAGADYVCDGVNDEVQIQSALDSLATTGGRVRLSVGNFIIDALPTVRNQTLNNGQNGDYKIGIGLPTGGGNEFIIEGDTMFFTQYSQTYGKSGTSIKMSDTLYTSLNDPDDGTAPNEQYALFAPKTVNGKNVSVQLRNLGFQLPWNGKKIICVDVQYIERVTIDHVVCYGFRRGFDPNWDHSAVPTPMPVVNCVGFRSVNGGNWGTCLDFKNVSATGFHTGFQLGGEHLVGVNMAALNNYYGYTFGRYDYTGIFCHTMTLINCSDEQSACGPLFHHCSQYQDIHIIGWNEERYEFTMPGQTRVQNATCTNDDKMRFRGVISYAIMDGNNGQWISKTNLPFWEDGHGANFVTRNATHKNVETWTNISNYYYGDLGEIIYDTTNDRLVVCKEAGIGDSKWQAIATTSIS